MLDLGMDTWDASHRIILIHILIAAILTITRNWKVILPPSPQLVPQLLNQHLQMELMFAKANLTLPKIQSEWTPWLIYSNIDTISLFKYTVL